MNPILPANPSSISAILAAAPAPQAGSGPGGRGGFAATFAAAQGSSTLPQIAVKSSVGSVAKSGGTPTNLNPSTVAPGNSLSKKLANNNLLASLSAAAVNASVVSQNFPAAIQLPLLTKQPSLLHGSVAQPLQTGPPMPTGVQPRAAVATVQSSLQTSVSNAALPSAALDDPALNQTVFNQTTSNQTVLSQVVPSRGLLTQTGLTQTGLNQTVANQTVANQTVPVTNPAESASLLPSLQKTAGSLPDSATRNVLFPNDSALVTVEPTQLAGNTQPTGVPAVAGQFVSSTGLPNTSQDSQSGEFFTNDGAPALADPMLQPDQRIESGAYATTLLANANAETGAATGESSVDVANLSIANLKISGTSSGDATTPDTVQTNLAAQMTGPASLPEIMSGQISSRQIINGQTSSGQIFAPSVLNSATQTGPGKPSLSPAVRATAQVHGAGQGAEAPAAAVSISSSASALPTSALPTGSESGDGSTLASQTPFSIFFSGPGPGAESAASALPKMMLPVSSSAIRGHATGAEAASSNPQPGSLPGGFRPNSAPQNTKEQTSGTEGASLQSAQPLRADADPSANVQLVSPQTAITPGPAPQSSAGVALPLSGQSAPAGESLPKPQTLPAGSSGSAAPSVPAAPEPVALGAVQVAQLVSRLGQSEMRIGLNTAAFGSVEVRTVVRTSDVGLVIGSEKGDLRALLANEMPAITNTLQQQNLKLNSVNFMQGFAFSNNASGGGNSQQQSFAPMRAAADSASADAPREESGESQPAVRWGETSISILA